ncbi:hypothetical protein ACJX0J_041307, partial [Zea mays]
MCIVIYVNLHIYVETARAVDDPIELSAALAAAAATSKRIILRERKSEKSPDRKNSRDL